MIFIERIFQPPKNESYFLFGPRGTGKTTWLKKTYSYETLWIDLLNLGEERRLSARPELLKEQLDLKENVKWVIIDEIQKVPKLLDIVHLLIEEKKGRQFVLTGSSARKLRKGGVNLLGGRALWRNFHPFLACELKEQFQLDQVLKTGLIPLIWAAENKEQKLQAYVDLYLKEEVKAEALVRQIGNFSRFLEVMAFSHASLINFSNISRECEVPRKTVENYFQILCDLLLGYTLPIFEKKVKKELSSHPKFYFFDPGVFRSLKKMAFLDTSLEIEGAALEGLVAEHLRSWISYQSDQNSLYFWRTRSGVEVDFIIYGEKNFYAIEVKNAKNLNPQDFSGLKSFQTDCPNAFCLLLYRGNEAIKKGNILCLPVEMFLKKLHPRETLEAIWK
jgi:uncharacterized protein